MTRQKQLMTDLAVPKKAAKYLELIAKWQQDNGGFRRLPPRLWDVKLSNWVQFCRTAYRNGQLNPNIATGLIDLGVSMDFATDGIQPSPETYRRASDAVMKLKSDLDAGREDWRGDASTMQWIAEMQALAAKRPRSPLIRDLAAMVSDVFNEFIYPHLGTDKAPPSLGRGTDAVLSAIIEFRDSAGRCPSMLSESCVERQLASWLIRWERGLLGKHAFSAEREDEQSELGEEIDAVLGREHPDSRLAEWHWWSLCALAVLERPEVGNRWHGRVYTAPVKSWARSLARDPRDNWGRQTREDHAAGRIATVHAVAVRLQAAMSYSTNEERLRNQGKATRRDGEDQWWMDEAKAQMWRLQVRRAIGP